MSVTTATHTASTGRATRRQIRNVELQTVDASRIIRSLSGRNGRSWPADREDARA